MKSLRIPSPAEALPGRAERMRVPDAHFVNSHRLEPPFPDGLERAMFGMGCFWGAEKKFWQQPGVYSTAVGYAAGHTPNPTYREVCSRHDRPQRSRARRLRSGKVSLRRTAQGVLGKPRSHAGDAPGKRRRHAVPLGHLLLRRGAAAAAEASRDAFQQQLTKAGYGPITTEILPAPEFYYAEDYHQQYLAKNPDGYCGLGGTGVSCPVGVGATRNVASGSEPDQHESRATSLDSLPIDPFIDTIADAVRRSRAVVVTAQPGAGKTTRVPPALVDRWSRHPAPAAACGGARHRPAHRRRARLDHRRGGRLADSLRTAIRAADASCWSQPKAC